MEDCVIMASEQKIKSLFVPVYHLFFLLLFLSVFDSII